MLTSTQTFNLISTEERTKLDKIMNAPDVSNPSLRDRIISAVTFPIFWIANCMENLALRIVDPNWKALIIKPFISLRLDWLEEKQKVSLLQSCQPHFLNRFFLRLRRAFLPEPLFSSLDRKEEPKKRLGL